jgi:hypothetical protein
MSNALPIRYVLTLYDGPYGNDCGGIEATTPFIPMQVGDTIDHGLIKDVIALSKPKEGYVYSVAAIKHSFAVFDTHITQYVHVSLVTSREKL